jgi:cation diffusion facilitator CzcD-associated flavoprotein CzcO
MTEKRFAIIGAGMSGILCAIKLKQAGHEHVTVYEKADRIGGTWRDNVYPGLTCDVPAHAYTYEFEPNPEWSAYLVGGDEIQAYFETVVDKYNVRELMRFNSEIVRMEWKDDLWEIETSNGTINHAHAAILATGVLHHPKIPDIPGLDLFDGIAMHTAQWDRAVPLDGKRIGIVGNGSTGIQAAVELGGRQRLDVVHFQRNPQWIFPYPNFPYTDEDRARFRASRDAIEEIRQNEQYWAAIRRFTTGVVNIDGDEMHEVEQVCRNHLADPHLSRSMQASDLFGRILRCSEAGQCRDGCMRHSRGGGRWCD